MKITPKRYVQGFCVIVLALAIVRELNASFHNSGTASVSTDTLAVDTVSTSLEAGGLMEVDSLLETSFVPHRIFSVPNFKNAFPDENDVQLLAAEKNGVTPLRNREAVERMKEKLVYVGSNPYFYVDKMRNSIPYLVPKAAVLVQDIGKAFYDSLEVKGIPLHKIIVTSVLRTDEDVQNLQRRNLNAAEKSCHQYATTVDICYNRYKTVEDPAGLKRREVRNDSLKWVLSEVLNDMRQQNRCYVKYEVKQGCFHLTVR